MELFLPTGGSLLVASLLTPLINKCEFQLPTVGNSLGVWFVTLKGNS